MPPASVAAGRWYQQSIVERMNGRMPWAVMLLPILMTGCLALTNFGDWDVVKSNEVEGVLILTREQPTIEMAVEITAGNKELSSESNLSITTVVTPLHSTTHPAMIRTETTNRDGSDLVEFHLGSRADIANATELVAVEVRWTMVAVVEGETVDGLEDPVLVVDKPLDSAAAEPIIAWQTELVSLTEQEAAMISGVEVVAFEITVQAADTQLSVASQVIQYYPARVLRVGTDAEMLELAPGQRLPLAIPSSCAAFPCTFTAFVAAQTRFDQIGVVLYDDDDSGATADLIDVEFVHNRRSFELGPIDVVGRSHLSFDIDITVDGPPDPIAAATDFVHVQFAVERLTGSRSEFYSNLGFENADFDTRRGNFGVAVPTDLCCNFVGTGRLVVADGGTVTSSVTAVVDYLSLAEVDLDELGLIVTVGELEIEIVN